MKNNTNNPRITFPLLGEAMFRALALEPGTSNANKWYRKFRLKRSNREKSNTLEGITFFPENFRWNEPFHLFSYWNNRFFHTNGKRSKVLLTYRHSSKGNAFHNVDEGFAHVSLTVIEVSQCLVLLPQHFKRCIEC